MTKLQYLPFLILNLCISLPILATESWMVSMEEDPINKSNVCLLISKTYTIEDGQTTTPVQLIYNGEKLLAKTKSDIDMTYPNIGLQVDTHDQHKITRVYNKNIAVFADTDHSIHQQFIDGHRARLTLGFWPTWPQTHSRTINFSLIGYTKAHTLFKKCQNDGKLSW